jgi:hypothetical protein
MGDELIARAAQLVSVTIARKLEGTGDRLSIDRYDRPRLVAVAVAAFAGLDIELLDHGEDVRQQLLAL